MPGAATGSRALGVAGAALGLAALGFVGATLADHGDELRDAVDGASVAWLLVALGLSALAMTSIALPWRHAIATLGGPLLPRRESVPRFFLGEIGKYLPGGAWPVVGRAELAVRAGVSRPVA